MTEVTFKVWSPARNANRLFPLRRFYLNEAEGEYIEFAHIAVDRGGKKRDDYEVSAHGVLAGKALDAALAKAPTGKAELEKLLRTATINSKTRVLGRRGLRNDFKTGLGVDA